MHQHMSVIPFYDPLAFISGWVHLQAQRCSRLVYWMVALGRQRAWNGGSIEIMCVRFMGWLVGETMCLQWWLKRN